MAAHTITEEKAAEIRKGSGICLEEDVPHQLTRRQSSTQQQQTRRKTFLVSWQW